MGQTENMCQLAGWGANNTDRACLLTLLPKGHRLSPAMRRLRETQIEGRFIEHLAFNLISVRVIQVKERLRNYSRMKETKNTWQQNEKRDFELYPSVLKVWLGRLATREWGWLSRWWKTIVDDGCTVDTWRMSRKCIRQATYSHVAQEVLCTAFPTVLLFKSLLFKK